MGATLEIQRSQQMEAIEQHMQRQQVKKHFYSKRLRTLPFQFLGANDGGKKSSWWCRSSTK